MNSLVLFGSSLGFSFPTSSVLDSLIRCDAKTTIVRDRFAVVSHVFARVFEL